VAINARAAARREIGGVERWARELSRLLPEVRPDRYRTIQPPAALAHRAGQAWEQLALPLAARGAELILSPANLAPVTGRRNVVVIHDSAPFRQPAWYGRAYGAWHRALIPRVARRARLVIAPSEHVRDELVELFSLPRERVVAIAPGVDPSFASPADPAPLLSRLRLSRPYVLAVGTDSPRKNLGLLDEVAPRLAEKGLEVAIAGSTRSYMPTGPAATAARAPAGSPRDPAARAPAGSPRDPMPRARRLGYVADADLPALYAGAAAFAMPSLYEGFGLPCVEAMAAGTPVVASDRDALPEACGEAALLADPDDPDAFAAALLDAAGPERERLVGAGRERAAQLTWQRTAESVDRALEPLLATDRRP
jgi:glycosyltransferase involved in cell wall biosynthesis